MKYGIKIKLGHKNVWVGGWGFDTLPGAFSTEDINVAFKYLSVCRDGYKMGIYWVEEYK